MDRSNTRRRFIANTATVAVTAPAIFSAPAVLAGNASINTAARKRAATTAENNATNAMGSSNTLVPPLEVRVFHKMGFGPARRRLADPSTLVPDPNTIISSSFEIGSPRLSGQDDVSYFLSLGDDDDERLSAYVEQQLDPGSIKDLDFDTRMAPHLGEFASLEEPRIDSYQDRECNGDQNIYLRPLRDVRNMAFNRAIYSKKQLFELIVDFWHNHFNVFVRNNRDVEVGWGSWDRDIIRKNAFGNFADMVVASGKHPVMLRYLDNYVNSAGGINENYARELFELHTLGAINYGGINQPFPLTGSDLLAENPYTTIQSFDMGRFADNGVQITAQYFDTDVYEAAAALTGWRYDQNGSSDPGSCDTGEFFVDAGDHNENPKSILSPQAAVIPDNLEPEAEGELVMRVAAYHPGTAQHIALKLCQRLISDNPPQAVVDEAAAVFFAHRESADQIKRTLRVVLLSDAFKNTWGEKIKRPFEYVCSAMRAAGGQHVFRENNENTQRFHWEFDDTKQELFHWRTPDGYPDNRQFWQGSTSLVQTWQNIDWVLDRDAGNSSRRMMRTVDLMQELLPDEPTPREIAEFWCNWVMGYSPPGGWVGGFGTPYQSSPTKLGGLCLQFITLQSLPRPSVQSLWPADEKITVDISRDDWPYYWRTRINGMVDLILWSPTFIQR